MASQHTIDDDLYIVEHVFNTALTGAEKKFGQLNHDTARDLVYELKRRRRGGKIFAEVKSQLVRDKIKTEYLWSRYHSFLTRYFKGEKRTPASCKVPRTRAVDEELMRYLRSNINEERVQIDTASGENIIDSEGIDFDRPAEPEYEGPEPWDD